MQLSVNLHSRFPLPTRFTSWHSYFSRYIGERRLTRILDRLQIPLREKDTILEKNLALLLLAIREPRREDLQEAIDRPDMFLHTKALQKELAPFRSVEELSPNLFKQLYEALADPFDQEIQIEVGKDELEDRILNGLYFLYASFRYDPFWYMKERRRLKEDDYDMPLPLYYEKLAGFYATCEDLEVGSYLPHPSKERNLYCRVAAKLFTASGQISWLLVPATKTMQISPIRMTRGTPGHPAGYDFASHIVTDFEKEIGKTGYESGLEYEEQIQSLIHEPYIEIGYSIGGAIAQYRTAAAPAKVKELWTFRSPGVPRKVWKMFQTNFSENPHPLRIEIYRSKRDIVDFSGEVHLGYQAPEGVSVRVTMMEIPRLLPHRYTPIDPKIIRMEPTEVSDALLDNAIRGKLEKTRQVWGPPTVSCLARFCRDFYRKAPFHRVHKVKGLWMEEV